MRPLLALTLFMMLIALAYADTYNLKLGSESEFNRISKLEVCTTEELTIVYQLKIQNKHYVTSRNGNLEGSACGQEFKKVTGGLKAVETFTKLAADDVCAAKCGATQCLCENGMVCNGEQAANPCVVNFKCTDNKCTPNKGILTKIRYRFERIDDDVQREAIRKGFRDGISKYGVDAHCWSKSFVYDIPLNKDGTEYELTILDNQTDKKGCGHNEFTVQAKYYPKIANIELDPEKIFITMQQQTHEISLECLDLNVNLLNCGSKCYAPCPANALCTTNDDCLYGKCQTNKDIDGADKAEKRCNDSNAVSLLIAVVLVIIVLVVF